MPSFVLRNIPQSVADQLLRAFPGIGTTREYTITFTDIGGQLSSSNIVIRDVQSGNRPVSNLSTGIPPAFFNYIKGAFPTTGANRYTITFSPNNGQLTPFVSVRQVQNTSTTTTTPQRQRARPPSLTASPRRGTPAPVTVIEEDKPFYDVKPPGVATLLEIHDGNGQTGYIASSLDFPLRVMVRDQYYNPFPNTTVFFTTGNIHPPYDLLTTSSADSNESGIVSTDAILASGSGNNVITASLSGGVSPVYFTATGIASAAYAMNITEVDSINQTASVSEFPFYPPRVYVSDKGGNPVIGHPVLFYIASGGGNLQGQSSLTTNTADDSEGFAGIAGLNWQLGPSPGLNTLVVTSSGFTIGNVQVFNALATEAEAPPEPASMEYVQGNGQSAIVSQSVAIDPAVRVLDTEGNPVEGYGVIFSLDGGGIMTGSDLSISTASAFMTNASGIVSASWRLGSSVIPLQQITAVTALAGSPIIFTASALPDAPAIMSIDSGNQQTQTVGSAVSSPISVLITDNYHNPIPSIPVEFTVVSGGGSVSSVDDESPVAFTDETGVAYANWTLGTTAGINAVQAFSESLSGSPLSFFATGTAAGAASMSLNAGNQQSAVVSQSLATPISVIVTDIYGNPVSGQAIRFNIVSGSGQLTGSNATTNISGIASASWRMGSIVGVNAVQATSSLSGSPVSFFATGTVAAAATMSINAGNQQSATVSQSVATPPSVIVRDNYTNVVSGVPIRFLVVSGSGLLTGSSAVTNTSGIASASWRLGAVAGVNAVQATASLFGSRLSFFATGTAAAASTIALSAGNGQTASVSTAVATPPTVIVRDAFSNPVSGVDVKYIVASGSGIVTSSNRTTNASGLASSSWTLGSTPGLNAVIATASGLSGSPVVFTASGSGTGSSEEIVWTELTKFTFTASSPTPSGWGIQIDQVGTLFITGSKMRALFSSSVGGGAAPGTIYYGLPSAKRTVRVVQSGTVLSTSPTYYINDAGLNKNIFYIINGQNSHVFQFRAASGSGTGAITAGAGIQGVQDRSLLGNVEIVRGTSYVLDYRLTTNTAGNNDGRIEIYVNGQLVSLQDLTTGLPAGSDIQWSTGTGLVEEINWSPVFGGSGLPPGQQGPENFWQDVASITVYYPSGT